MKRQPCGAKRQRRGAMLVLVVVMMFVLIAMTAFSINIAQMHLTRTELRTSTDAAARAASESLSRTQDTFQATQAAQLVASSNLVSGKPLQLNPSDIVFGGAVQNKQGKFVFQAGASPTNSVRIAGRRTSDSASGSVSLFMGSMLGTGSFEPEVQSTSTSFIRDIALVVDRSGSMRGSKIAALKIAVREFVDVLDSTAADERISFTSYSSSSTKETSMASVFSELISKNNAMPAGGTTAIGEGLNDGIDSVLMDAASRPFAEKAIVLMTDGNENTGVPVLNVVPRARNKGLRVHTIAFGADADTTLMQEVANQTGGTFQHALNNDELREAFRKIAQSLAVVMID